MLCPRLLSPLLLFRLLLVFLLFRLLFVIGIIILLIIEFRPDGILREVASYVPENQEELPKAKTTFPAPPQVLKEIIELGDIRSIGGRANVGERPLELLE